MGGGCLGLLCILLCLGSIPAKALSPDDRAVALQSGRVGEDVLDVLDAEGRADVIIALSAHQSRWTRAARSTHRERLRREVDAPIERVLASLAPGDLRVRRRFESTAALAGEITSVGLLRLLSRPEVLRIDLDSRVTVQLGEAVSLVNLDLVQGLGNTGVGIEVAIVDTGVDLDHPDLLGAVSASQCFCKGDAGATGCCPNGLETMSGIAAGEDEHGHGTMVASVVASNGTHASVGGAPGVSLVSVKVIGPTGAGSSSDVLAGLDWLVMNRPDVNVVNLSIAISETLYTGVCDFVTGTTFALTMLLGNLRAGGALIVTGAGNHGSGDGMSIPACLTSAFSVGAVWDADVGNVSLLGCTDDSATDLVACFSNSNALTDLFAPGALITASALNGTTTTSGGTSFAAPLASACAALLYEASPLSTPDEIANALRTSSVLVTDDTNGLDFPRLDCRAAYDVLVPMVYVPAGSEGMRVTVALLLVAMGVWVVERRATGGRGEA